MKDEVNTELDVALVLLGLREVVWVKYGVERA